MHLPVVELVGTDAVVIGSGLAENCHELPEH